MAAATIKLADASATGAPDAVHMFLLLIELCNAQVSIKYSLGHEGVRKPTTAILTRIAHSQVRIAGAQAILPSSLLSLEGSLAGAANASRG